MRHWLFSCKRVSALISQSMDRKLPLYKRMGIQFHLMMCVLCRRYRKQLLLIRSVLQESNRRNDSPCDKLPADARGRIEKEITKKIACGDSCKRP